MTDTLSIKMWPAFEGDAIEIRWAQRRLFVDLGRVGTGRRIAKSIAREGADEIDLVVISHIDVDHIGGALSALTEPDSPIGDVTIGDIWFNGFRHLPHPEVDANEGGHEDAELPSSLEEYGIPDGFAFERWLAAGQPWNLAFEGGAVVREIHADPTIIDLEDGLRLTVIGPTPDRLEALREPWAEFILEEERKLEEPDEPDQGELERYGGGEVAHVEDVVDLELLAETANTPDTISNGSSIALILEWRGRRVLLAGDAFPDDLLDGIEAAETSRHFDVVKASHHGSKNNVTVHFTDTVTADTWAVSTSGSRHDHPDAAAIARILLSSLRRREAALAADVDVPSKPHLAFNLRSAFNEIWDTDELRDRFSYTTTYGTKDDGLEIVLTAKE